MATPITDVNALVEKIKKYARENYSRGGDVIVECYSDSEIITDFIAMYMYEEKAMERVANFCRLQKEVEEDVLGEIF